MNAEADAPPVRPPWLVFLLAAALLAAHLGLGLASALDKSAVFDEVVYAPVGP